MSTRLQALLLLLLTMVACREKPAMPETTTRPPQTTAPVAPQPEAALPVLPPVSPVVVPTRSELRDRFLALPALSKEDAPRFVADVDRILPKLVEGVARFDPSSADVIVTRANERKLTLATDAAPGNASTPIRVVFADLVRQMVADAVALRGLTPDAALLKPLATSDDVVAFRSAMKQSALAAQVRGDMNETLSALNEPLSVALSQLTDEFFLVSSGSMAVNALWLRGGGERAEPWVTALADALLEGRDWALTPVRQSALPFEPPPIKVFDGYENYSDNDAIRAGKSPIAAVLFAGTVSQPRNGKILLPLDAPLAGNEQARLLRALAWWGRQSEVPLPPIVDVESARKAQRVLLANKQARSGRLYGALEYYASGTIERDLKRSALKGHEHSAALARLGLFPPSIPSERAAEFLDAIEVPVPCGNLGDVLPGATLDQDGIQHCVLAGGAAGHCVGLVRGTPGSGVCKRACVEPSDCPNGGLCIATPEIPNGKICR
jgi:hypothetical protein